MLTASKLDATLLDYMLTIPDRPKKLSDRFGLYLYLTPQGSALWRWKFRLAGKERTLAIGAYRTQQGSPTIGLAAARDAMERAKVLLKQGVDPTAAKRATVPSVAAGITFAEMAKAYVAAHGSDWTSAKHAAYWWDTLEAYAFPTLGNKPVDQIEPEHVAAALRPIWNEKRPTARRVLERIARVLGYSTVLKKRSGPNPALWKDCQEHLLPKAQPSAPPHHKALDWKELPAFMAVLRAEPSASARAIEFCILTAAC